MSVTGKEYNLAIRIAGTVDKSFNVSLNSANSSLRTLRKTLGAVDQDFTRLDSTFGSIIGVGQKCFSAIASASGMAAAAMGSAVASCTNAASEYEGQMSNVAKYVSGLADAEGKVSDALARNADGSLMNYKTYEENYKEMKEALLDLSTQIPMTAGELTELAAAAGQSGYGIAELLQYDSGGNISGFLKDTAVMGTAMDISAAQAGEWAAKWENAFNMTHEEVMVLADQINYLGANSATTAAEIAQAVNDAASLGQVAGIDVSTTAALADAMLATGVSSDKVATSVKRTITNMVKGSSATEAMKKQWEELGFTADGVAIAMQEDSIGTLKEVFTAIGDLPDYKQVAALGTLFGQWAIEGDAKIVSNMQVFQDALDMVGDPQKYGNSMEREFTIKAGTSGSIDTMLGNAIQAMKINVGDSFLPIKKEYGQKMIGFINGITEKMTGFNDYLAGADGLSKWVKNAETKFPTLLRKFNKYAQPVLSGFVDAGKWVAKHGKAITSVIAGIGGALAAYKIESTVSHAVQAVLSLGSLNPVTMGLLGVAAAVGGVATAFAAIKQHEKEMVDRSLADHFGNIALSMEEIQKVAEHIISAGSLSGVKKALEEFGELDGIYAAMEETASEIDKMNWKVSIGMELTEEENESYKQAIDDYIKSAQEYALQTQYAVSLNLEFAFSEDYLKRQNVVTKVNQFYQDKYDELADLGTKLNDALTEAFSDGLLTFPEAQVIADLQRQMAEVEKALAVDEFETNLSMLGMKYAGLGSLTPESFQNVQYEIAEQEAALKETYLKSYARNSNSFRKAYEAGNLTEGEYQYLMQGAQEEYLANMAEVQARGVNAQIEAIMSQYADELDPAIESYMLHAQETIAQYAENSEWWEKDPASMWVGLFSEFGLSSSLDGTSKKAVAELLELLQPTVEKLKETKQQMEDIGQAVPDYVLKRISDFELLDVLSQGNLDPSSVGNILGEQLARSEHYDSFYKDIIAEYDYYVPEAVTDGISNATAAGIAAAAETNVRPTVERMYLWTQEAIDEYYSQEFHAVADVDITLNPAMRYSPSRDPVLTGIGSLDIDQNADGGIIRNMELSWLAEEGPEAVIPLDGSRNAISLWEKTGQLLGMKGAFDDIDLGGGRTVIVDYNPTLNFYGEAPSKDDLTDAFHISEDEFDSYMKKWIKRNSRLLYG